MGILNSLNKITDGVGKATEVQSEYITRNVDKLVATSDDGIVLQGLLGNYSVQDAKKTTEKWGKFLVEDEEIIVSYKLIRDELLVTNYRIIFIDAQGATGQKKAITQIYLDSIIDVNYTSAGFGFDETEITICYITNPYKQALQTTISEHEFAFPKKQEVTHLYRFLVKLSIENRQTINQK